jgi:cytochrome bd-type quinol oxidase subunit 2
MSYEFYKVLHLLAILFVFTTLGGLAMIAWLSRGGTPTDELRFARRTLAIINGIAILIVFVAGFGLMARTGVAMSAWPIWIYGKIGVWLLVAASIAVVRRRGGLGWYLLLPLLGAVGAWLAVNKPV